MDRSTRAKLLGIGVLATAAVAVRAAHAAGNNDKVNINHKGNTISVSCNALDGHAQHADADELRSVRIGAENCAKRADH